MPLLTMPLIHTCTCWDRLQHHYKWNEEHNASGTKNKVQLGVTKRHFVHSWRLPPTTRKNCGRINTKSTENRWSWLLFRSRWSGHWSTEGCWSISVDLVTNKILKKKSLPVFSGNFIFLLRGFFGQQKVNFGLPGCIWHRNPTRLRLPT
jgi:hypothetical protein